MKEAVTQELWLQLVRLTSPKGVIEPGRVKPEKAMQEKADAQGSSDSGVRL